MPITLTEQETKNKIYFTRMGTKNTNYMTAFHQTIQNPIKGTITFDGWSRERLHNGMLCELERYFTASTGAFLFEETKIKSLAIRNVCLKGYNNSLYDQMPDGSCYIANLIAKNPDLKEIDLSNTELGDHEASILLEAIKRNTDGNPISPSILAELQSKIAENIESDKIKSHAEIRTISRVLGQALRTGTSFFSTLPPELNAHIASFCGRPFHSEDEAFNIAADNLGKPAA